jgi:hypothetical protein
VYWEQALGGSIEVAIAIAGFSGIVAVFGQRRERVWRAADQLRLRVLLTASAVSLFFSILPFVALDSGLSEALFWHFGSGAQAVWLISIALYRIRQASLLGVAQIIQTKASIPLMILVCLAQIANAAFYGVSWLYVVGVIFQLFVAFSSFTGLLLDLWEDDEEAT